MEKISAQLPGSEEPKLDPERLSRLWESALIENRVVSQVRDSDERIHVRKSGPPLEREKSPEFEIETMGLAQRVHRARFRVQAGLFSHEPICQIN